MLPLRRCGLLHELNPRLGTLKVSLQKGLRAICQLTAMPRKARRATGLSNSESRLGRGELRKQCGAQCVALHGTSNNTTRAV